jgi:hypothetical protein
LLIADHLLIMNTVSQPGQTIATPSSKREESAQASETAITYEQLLIDRYISISCFSHRKEENTAFKNDFLINAGVHTHSGSFAK